MKCLAAKLVRDRQQMTSATLKKCIPSSWMEYQVHKIKMKIHVCFTYIAFQVLKVLLTKSYKIVATSSLNSSCFTSAFRSTDIIFYNFSELDSKLSKKISSSQIFLF